MWVERYLGAYNKIMTLQIKLKFPFGEVRPLHQMFYDMAG